MSTMTMDKPPATALALPDAMEAPAAPAPAAPAADPAVRTYRGRTLEELLPRIREELGADAIVVRQRDGLMGGVGGFFQQRFVEVDARAGAPRRSIDVYDDAPAAPESFALLLADADRAGGAGEDDSASLLAERLTPRQDPPAAAPEPEPERIASTLERAGMSRAFAERLLADAEAHELPFAGGDLRRAVRRALTRRIPTSLPHRAGGLAVAFAGTGSTSCADALASAYARAGQRAHAVATVEQARTRLDRGAADAVVALDLPPLTGDRDGVAELAGQLDRVELDETLLVLDADLDLAEAQDLHDRLTPLAPTGIALVCGEPPTRPGAAIELACTTRLPIAYVLDGSIAPADPAALAERLLP